MAVIREHVHEVDDPSDTVLPVGGPTPTLAEVLAAGNLVGIQNSIAGVDDPAGGGSVNIDGGASDGSGSTAYGANIYAGGGQASGAGGQAQLYGGDAATGSDAAGGDITLTAGEGDGAGANGKIIGTGAVELTSRTDAGVGLGAFLELRDADGLGAHAGLYAGDAFPGLAGGALTLSAGAGNDGAVPGGRITLQGGGGGGAAGRVTVAANLLVFLNLPTADPGVAGALWSDAGVVKVSAG